ncbi:MAG: SlyX family protein [Gammaproteobacteria bacterium]|nr:SlyX family protein [Gammaproteobacteria bacterium]MCF6229904.1 SlyX family protein [Gammaproteobacteria bacterium]
MVQESALEVEARIIELETKQAFQDDLLHELNDIVAEQSQTISALLRETQTLRHMLKNLASSNIAAQSEESPPPHY